MAVSARARRLHTRFNFVVEINGISSIGFSSCGPLQESVAKIEYWEGGSRIPIKVPGRYTAADITLERASAINDFDLSAWFRQVFDASADRGTDDYAEFKRDGEIHLLSPSGAIGRRWELTGMWPIDHTHGAFDASTDELNMEILVVAFDTLRTIPGST